MNKFSFYEASSISEALDQVNSTVSETIQPNADPDASVIKAGGIDLLDLMKEGLSNPGKVVSINSVPGMDEIIFDEKKGMRIGSKVTLSEIATHEEIKKHYLALQQSAATAATPHIRNVATLGGNLVQRTRCWYFRSKNHECYRKGSSTCFAIIGENEYHAIFGNENCASVHASSLATALMAFDAAIEITGKEGKVKVVSIHDFFVSPDVDPYRECILEPNEIITAVILPKLKKDTRSYYIKMGQRKSHDWPLADVAVVAELSGEKCKKANVVLGAAAPVPYVSKEAAEVIEGQIVNKENATAAGKAAMTSATPLSQNAYKIPIFETIIERAIAFALC